MPVSLSESVRTVVRSLGGRGTSDLQRRRSLTSRHTEPSESAPGARQVTPHTQLGQGRAWPRVKAGTDNVLHCMFTLEDDVQKENRLRVAKTAQYIIRNKCEENFKTSIALK